MTLEAGHHRRNRNQPKSSIKRTNHSLVKKERMRRRVYIWIVSGVLVIAACITIPCVIFSSSSPATPGGASGSEDTSGTGGVVDPKLSNSSRGQEPPRGSGVVDPKRSRSKKASGAIGAPSVREPRKVLPSSSHKPGSLLRTRTSHSVTENDSENELEGELEHESGAEPEDDAESEDGSESDARDEDDEDFFPRTVRPANDSSSPNPTNKSVPDRSSSSPAVRPVTSSTGGAVPAAQAAQQTRSVRPAVTTVTAENSFAASQQTGRRQAASNVTVPEVRPTVSNQTVVQEPVASAYPNSLRVSAQSSSGTGLTSTAEATSKRSPSSMTNESTATSAHSDSRILRAAVSAVASTGSSHSVSPRNQRSVAASAAVMPQLKAVAQSVASLRAPASDSSIRPSSQNQRSQPSMKTIVHNAVSGKISNSRANGLEDYTAGISDLARTVTDGIPEFDIMNLITRVGDHIDPSDGTVNLEEGIQSVIESGLVSEDQRDNVRVLIAGGLQAAQNGSLPSAEVERAGIQIMQSFEQRMSNSDSTSRPFQNAARAASAFSAFSLPTTRGQTSTLTAETAPWPSVRSGDQMDSVTQSAAHGTLRRATRSERVLSNAFSASERSTMTHSVSRSGAQSMLPATAVSASANQLRTVQAEAGRPFQGLAAGLNAFGDGITATFDFPVPPALGSTGPYFEILDFSALKLGPSDYGCFFSFQSFPQLTCVLKLFAYISLMPHECNCTRTCSNTKLS